MAHNIGQAMCFWILPKTCVPIARSTVQPISEDELCNPNIQQELQAYDAAVVLIIGDHQADMDSPAFELGSKELLIALLDADDDGHYHPLEPDAVKANADDFDEQTYHNLTAAEVLLPKEGYQYIARVIGKERDVDGNPIGRYHPNPILDTSIHEVEFPDGLIQDYAANVLTEALYTQVDTDGNRWLLLKEIIAYEKDDTAPSIEELRTKNIKFTTKGWKFCCLWIDGSSSWEAMKDLKHSNPIELAEYAAAHNILHVQAFSWWAKHVIKKKAHIIQKVKSRYWQRTHKYGIRLPKSVAEALEIDC
jgi:hypothetical protein